MPSFSAMSGAGTTSPLGGVAADAVSLVVGADGVAGGAGAGVASAAAGLAGFVAGVACVLVCERRLVSVEVFAGTSSSSPRSCFIASNSLEETVSASGSVSRPARRLRACSGSTSLPAAA